MHPNEQKIKGFYTHFNQRDAQKMANFYAKNVYFKDAVFELKDNEVNAMWQMLCQRAGADFKVSCKNIKASDTEGSAEWEAFYTFSQTGKKVHNRIKAHFLFKEGKVYQHIDTFDFWKWTRQAFGLLGFLIGWTSFFKRKVSNTAGQNLQKFIQKNKLS